MKRVFKSVVFSVVVVTSGTAFAGWSNKTQIASIEVDSASTDNGTATFLSFTATPTGKPGCATQAQGILTGSADHIKAMTSIANASLLSGKPVQVYWETGGCHGSFGQIKHLMIHSS